MGCEGIWPVIGPQSPTLDGIKLFMRAVLGSKPWKSDLSLLPLPWRDNEHHLGQEGAKKLKVGILWSDEVVKPQPPITRALKEVAEKLRGVPGIELVDWKPWKHEYAWELAVSL